MLKIGLFILWNIINTNLATGVQRRLLPFVIGDENSDGFERLARSASVYGLDLKHLHRLSGEESLEDSSQYLRKKLDEAKATENDVALIFIGGETSIINAKGNELLTQFDSLGYNVVFGAVTPHILPVLWQEYPKNDNKAKYLDSSIMVAKVSSLLDLLNVTTGYKDLPTAFNSIYINETERNRIGIGLDHISKAIQCIDTNGDDVEIRFTPGDCRIYNKIFGTLPGLLSGVGSEGHTAVLGLGNYIAESWTKEEGCQTCNDSRIYLDDMQESEYPEVLLGVFIAEESPFLEEMLEKVSKLNYPKNKIFLYVYNKIERYEREVIIWIKRNMNKYKSVKMTTSNQKVSPGAAKTAAISACIEFKCDVFFNVESFVHLDNPMTLRDLISYNRSILAPVIRRRNTAWSTFWGSIDNSYYKRSFDYMDIVYRDIVGIWNVPYVYGSYVVWRSEMTEPKKPLNFEDFRGTSWHQDMAFTLNNRKNKRFMHAINIDDYGVLLNMDRAKVRLEEKNNNLWQVEHHPILWESRYLLPNFTKPLGKDSYTKVCGDVFVFALFTSTFTKELMQNVINLERSNLEGVTVKDGVFEKLGLNFAAKMDLLSYDAEWKFILQTYIVPHLQVIFDYKGKGATENNAVLKYRSNEQRQPLSYEPSLYTLRVFLNSNTVDYEGTGWTFNGTNCPPITGSLGDVLVYPSSLLIQHNAKLSISRGDKYELVSFVQQSI